MAEARNHQPDAGCSRARAEGAFLALAAGDALGWPQEFDWERVRPKHVPVSENFLEWVRLSDGWHTPDEEVIRAGEYSDDTQMMLAVARCRTLPEPGWWTALARTELPLWTLYERGGGNATNWAAQNWIEGRAPWQDQTRDGAGQYFQAGGNGVAMRVVPHAIFFAGQPDASQLIHDVVVDGMATHGHPRALVGATAYAFAAWWYLRARETAAFGGILDVLLDGAEIWGALPESGSLPNGWLDAADAADAACDGAYSNVWRNTVREMRKLLERAREALQEGSPADDHAVLEDLGAFSPSKGAGTVSAAAALYLSARYAEDPVQGIVTAAFAHDSDTDTVAAMTGGLAGCLAGTEWMPGAWLDVQDSAYLREMANRVARGPAGTAERPLYPVGPQQLAELCGALAEGREDDLEFDGIRKATVADIPHPAPLGETEPDRIWRLRLDGGQTLYVTKCPSP